MDTLTAASVGELPSASLGVGFHVAPPAVIPTSFISAPTSAPLAAASTSVGVYEPSMPPPMTASLYDAAAVAPASLAASAPVSLGVPLETPATTSKPEKAAGAHPLFGQEIPEMTFDEGKDMGHSVGEK